MHLVHQAKQHVHAHVAHHLCVGTSIYAMPGLAVNNAEMPLDAFWLHPRGPEPDALKDFESVLKTYALVNGNFYTRSGISTAIQGILHRLDSTPDRDSSPDSVRQNSQGRVRKEDR